MQPPRMGPIGSETKLTAAQIPTALGRSSGVNSTARADIAITIRGAPAKPSRTRAARNSPEVWETAQPAEASPKSNRAPSITRLRPNRSPRRPAGSISAASTSR